MLLVLPNPHILVQTWLVVLFSGVASPKILGEPKCLILGE